MGNSIHRKAAASPAATFDGAADRHLFRIAKQSGFKELRLAARRCNAPTMIRIITARRPPGMISAFHHQATFQQMLNATYQ
jgi:hypothetical protein